MEHITRADPHRRTDADPQKEYEDGVAERELPLGDRLEQEMRDRLTRQYQEATRQSDIPPDIQQHIQQKASRNVAFAWWNTMNGALRRLGQESAAVDESLRVRRVFEYVADADVPTDHYQLIECGTEDELSAAELETIQQVLEYTDQFTSGVLSRYPSLRRIVAMVDQNIAGIGFASADGVLLNIPKIRDIARADGVDSSVAIGVVLAHELLGHQVDRYVNNFQELQGFAREFDYSDEKIVESSGPYDIHASIVPRDVAARDSMPVRLYGSTNPREDFATTAETIATRALGVTDTLPEAGKFGSTPDAYRDELMMRVFDEIARTTQGAGTFVGVGSPIVGRDTPEGLKYTNARSLHRVERRPEEFVEAEFLAVTS